MDFSDMRRSSSRASRGRKPMVRAAMSTGFRLRLLSEIFLIPSAGICVFPFSVFILQSV